jgi:hypothetical protein
MNSPFDSTDSPTSKAILAERLRLLRDEEMKFEALKSSLQDAIAELDQTGGTPLDFAEIKRKGRERISAV